MAYVIRKMLPDELNISIEWASKEGWNPGINDARCFYFADPQGFFIGLLDGEPIATGSAVIYNDHYAFCGLYIVKAGFRAQGYGIQLTDERLKYVGNRLTGLDGVLDKVSKYERLGYRSAHQNIRYGLSNLPDTIQINSCVVELKTIPFSSLEKFDRRYFPAPRATFLQHWINQPAGYALGYLEGERLLGYGVIRKCQKGYKIGPLFAENNLIAHVLFQSLCGKVNGGPVYVDIPESNLQAQDLVKEYGMKKQFEVMRMYRNGLPNIDLQGIYGITTFELG